MSDINYVEVTISWLRRVARQIVEIASRESVGGKSGSAQGAPKITSRSTATKAVIEATGAHFGRPALDSEISIPIGGFAPTAESARILGVRPGGGLQIRGGHWVFIKPEGTIVRRTRVYNRFSGQIIKRKGFMTKAAEGTLEGTTGQSNLDALALQIATALAAKLAEKIVRDLNLQGVNATIA